MNASETRHKDRAGVLELVTAVHLAVFLAATTWALGGNGLWLRPALAAWGSLGAIITLAALFFGRPAGTAGNRAYLGLWPLLLFNLLVLVSLLTPGFREVRSGGETMLIPRELSAVVPAAAIPGEARQALWMFDAIYLSCFNLVLVARHRRTLRGLLLFAVANAFVLAVFGTLQKFSYAEGPFFGLVKTRQPLFFSSFLYHNHWGPFVILMTTVCVGLAWHFGRQGRGRNFFHTPAFAGLVAVFFLAATVPLSGSRSCTLLLALILMGFFVQWLFRAVAKRRRRGAPIAAPVAGALAAIAIACAAIGFLASETIALRIALTEQQLAAIRAQGGLGDRSTLYRDTWRMALDKPWFGWGMASYPHVFMLYNTQQPDSRDRLPRFYSSAHNDWLQALAEHGFVGAALLALCALVPLRGLRRADLAHTTPFCLMTGCAAVLLYALIEFPFGNVAVVLTWWLCFFCAAAYAFLLQSGCHGSADDAGGPHNAPDGAVSG
jgi:O-antigen ligase